MAVLITGGLGLAPFIEWLAGLVKSGVEEWLKKRRRAEAIAIHTQEFVDYIPFMNDDERAIFGYLLEHQQKTFTAEMNCGTGAALLKRGFIKSQVIVGLSYDMAGFPFLVPDHIWEKLEEYRDAFPQKHTGGSLPWFKGVW
ncbi:hypothetical protein GS636_06800 [Ruegeria sp. HKCCD4884]|uniref:hypothetical protein n=1 Tax=Ruegeria sp. HKCCD4884 TaxID=2683022 RepID=UPI001492A0BD|nr:hypothetical protein [Ruegeria sp. HKCCD4884]NOD92490.1 hypothetical protein [Ruegeria sp. HKCCD4884]